MANCLGPLVILNQPTVSATGAYNSTPMDLREITRYSLQTESSGSASGTYTIQGSLDYQLPGVGTPTWSTIAGISLTSVAGITANQILDVSETGIPWVRVVYTHTGGSGAVEVLGHAKGL